MKRFLIAVLLFVLLVAVSCTLIEDEGPGEEGLGQGDRLAVVVGLSEFKYDLSEYVPGEMDAKEIAEELSFMWGDDNVKLLINSEATKKGIKSAIYDWLDPKEGKGDTVLFFFSGHGIREYISPYDASGNFESWLSSREISKWLNILGAERVVVVLNTCYSGSFIDNLSRDGRVIITCAEADQECWGVNSEDLRIGLFPTAIQEAFLLERFIMVDSNHDNQVSIEEIFRYAKTGVEGFIKKYPKFFTSPQHPQIDDRYTGEVIIFGIEDFFK